MEEKQEEQEGFVSNWKFFSVLLAVVAALAGFNIWLLRVNNYAETIKKIRHVQTRTVANSAHSQAAISGPVVEVHFSQVDGVLQKQIHFFLPIKADIYRLDEKDGKMCEVRLGPLQQPLTVPADCRLALSLKMKELGIDDFSPEAFKRIPAGFFDGLILSEEDANPADGLQVLYMTNLWTKLSSIHLIGADIDPSHSDDMGRCFHLTTLILEKCKVQPNAMSGATFWGTIKEVDLKDLEFGTVSTFLSIDGLLERVNLDNCKLSEVSLEDLRDCQGLKCVSFEGPCPSPSLIKSLIRPPCQFTVKVPAGCLQSMRVAGLATSRLSENEATSAADSDK